ncbi:MAG: YihY/virulence factor BrkB family protein [Deltaproteobacteria bacterium]|nr:YihY/virulence factor BrkB family protein [Deltaproteobacteria bacterium]
MHNPSGPQADTLDSLQDKYLGKGLLLRLPQIFYLAQLGFRRNHLSLHSAGLSFFTLLTMIPFLAMFLALLKAFHVENLLNPVMLSTVAAGQRELAEKITVYVRAAETSTLGLVGILTLLITGFVLLQRVRNSLNIIWDVWIRPGYGQRVAEYLLVLAVTPFLVLISFALSAYLKTIQEIQLLSMLELPDGLVIRIGALSGYPIFWLLLFYAYMFIPETKVRWHHAMLGALVAGTCIKLVEGFYILTMLRVTSYEAIYGAVAMIPFMMIWMYLGWMMFLFGAQLACVSQHFHLFQATRQISLRHAESYRPYLALTLLAAIDHQFRKKGEPVNLSDISKKINLPISVAQEITLRMVRKDLLTPVRDSGMKYVPASSTDTLTVFETLNRLDMIPLFAEHPPLGTVDEAQALTDVLVKSNLGITHPLQRITIHELSRKLYRPPANPVIPPTE